MAWKGVSKLKRLGQPGTGYRSTDGCGDGGCCRCQALLFELNILKYRKKEKNLCIDFTPVSVNQMFLF